MNLRPPVLVLIVGLTSCGSESAGDAVATDAGADTARDVGSNEGSTDSGADAAEPDSSTALTWHPIREPADAIGDCLAVDEQCAADLVQVWFTKGEAEARFAVELESEFPVDTGSLELFLMPPEPPLVGYSFRFITGELTVWQADCSTARHAGCHWSKMPAPDHVEAEWATGARFEVTFDAGQLFGRPVDRLLVGAGAAPFAIQKTAEFTDRYPDEVWVTSTGILGLVEVSLVP